MSGLEGKTNQTEVERSLISILRENDGSIDSDLLTEANTDLSEDELRRGLSELLDKHRISLSEDWNYELME